MLQKIQRLPKLTQGTLIKLSGSQNNQKKKKRHENKGPFAEKLFSESGGNV